MVVLDLEAKVTRSARNLYRVMTTDCLLMVWPQLMRVVLLRALSQPEERCIAGARTQLVTWELTPQL
jgi:hypothetical protein